MNVPEPIKGAGRCPSCGSRKVRRVPIPDTRFYATELEACCNCDAAWEPFDPAKLLDADIPRSSFVEPCNNCAFRPDSPEQRDTQKWRELMEQLKQGDGFYCHKGVPIDPASENGFQYPVDRQGKPIAHKLRLCRGYLNMLSRQLEKGEQA